MTIDNQYKAVFILLKICEPISNKNILNNTFKSLNMDSIILCLRFWQN